ncbi:MAG: hypothetical protein IJ861_04195 [Clostridia bacterium]|nr:hypothetical protein [Clostridia bacterium]
MKKVIIILNTSNLYKELVQQSGRTFRAKIFVTFSDGSETVLTDDDIMQNSLVISGGTSDEGVFSIGSAIIGELDFEIDNSSGKYDNMSFEDAVFDVRIGLVTEQKYDGTLTVEWLRKGLYTAEEVTVNENYISIIAYDNMAKFDVPFSDVHFPATLGQIYAAVCNFCGVPYDSLNFPNADLQVKTGEYITDDTSCREILSYIAQLACCFAYADNVGIIHLSWYSTTDYNISEEQKLNGTVTVSGVQLTDTDENVWLSGTKNYCIVIDDNPLAADGTAIKNAVWNQRLIGMQLTPFSADIISDPCLETGDIVIVSDINGNTYLTPITNIIYRLDGKMTVSCDAETIKEKQRTRLSPSARIIAAAKRNTAQQISEYDIRAKQFSELTANAMGYYQTEEIQDDGSVICYQHDKPLLSESRTIWKKSVDSFAVSNDGGKTWKGMDSTGSAVLDILAAVGIVADWINVGTLTGVEIIATLGSIAGWKMENGVLVSSDGTIKIDSRNNIISIYDANGSLLFTINSSGIKLYRDNKSVGNIGYTTNGNGEHGLAFNIDNDGSFMCWGKQASGTTRIYDPVFQYTKGEGFEFTGSVKIAGNLTVNGNLTVGKLNGYKLMKDTYTSSNGTMIQYWGWKDDN